ncbi:MAG: tail fiber protein [Burkholderiaceae bacterium]|nr:tail fiber protein [Burkholderiaceae bacterium]
MEVYLGSIMTFGFNFAPYQWQLCNGQTLAISQYSALFALIGTYYGGNGTSTFQLPDLQGRMAIGQGNGAGLTPRVIGESSGSENVSILVSNMPTHLHTVTPSFNVSTEVQGNKLAPSATNNVLAGTVAGSANAASIWATSTPAPTIPLGGGSAVNTSQMGGGVPAPSMNPYLALNFSIAMAGLFPSRN